MSTFVPLLSRAQIENLPDRAREVVEYRKSGLSLNHIQGCPLDCAYCIRHTYGLWDQRVPRTLVPDDMAVEHLVTHRYFRAHDTPLQILNRATDPFLPSVRAHTLAVLRDLDARSLRNHVLVITRHRMRPEDIAPSTNWQISSSRCCSRTRASKTSASSPIRRMSPRTR